jgi:hypothetical protein
VHSAPIFDVSFPAEFADDLLVRRPVQLIPGPRGALLHVDLDRSRWDHVTYRDILPNFRKLAHNNIDDHAVRRFVERYGFFHLDQDGLPQWERVGPGGYAYWAAGQRPEVYRDLARFVDALVQVVDDERGRLGRVSDDTLLALARPLVAWGKRLNRVGIGHAGLVPTGLVQGAAIGAVLIERIEGRIPGTDVTHDISGLAIAACNAWLAAGHVQPFVGHRPGGTAKQLSVRWSGGSWGAIGEQLVQLVVGLSAKDVRCAYCHRPIRERKRAPSAGRPPCCKRSVCQRNRSRQYQQESRRRRAGAAA